MRAREKVRRGAGASGFTLMELLVVIAIVTLLASLLIAGLFPSINKAKEKKTVAILGSITTALDQYFAEYHDYPPDGYDPDPAWTNPYGGAQACTGNGILLGTPARSYMGSGCLIYFLCHPIQDISVIGAEPDPQHPTDPRNISSKTVGPYLTTLKLEDFTAHAYDTTFNPAIGPGSSSFVAAWSVCEIVDGYGWPIHYDKVADVIEPTANLHFQPGRFIGSQGLASHSDQTYLTNNVAGFIDTNDNICPSYNSVTNTGGDVTFTAGTGASSIQHPDPRTVPLPDGCITQACAFPTAVAVSGQNAWPRNPNTYDLWSHGISFTNARFSLGNWKTSN